MSARRIARELAVIMLPQLPKDRARLERLEFDMLVTRSVQMLSDYARQCLADAGAFVTRAQRSLQEIEIEHPDNTYSVEELAPVAVTTGQLREQTDLLERALHLISEALDVPEVVAQAGTREQSEAREYLMRLISTYLDKRREIDNYINDVKAKWRIERMVSIDRDIIRLACTEAFYIADVPIRVAISEAVELSHRFADDRAAKFINGVLRDLAEHASEARRRSPKAATPAALATGAAAPEETVGAAAPQGEAPELPADSLEWRSQMSAEATPATSEGKRSTAGEGSTDIGTGSTDIGTGSTDIGTGSTDIGTGSTDIGTGSTDTGSRSTDIGPRSTDIGPRSTDIGPRSTDIGPRSTDIGTGSTDIGTGSTDTGPRSTDIGPRSTDIGPRSTDIGPRSTDIGPRSTDIGSRSTDIATGSAAGGAGSAVGELSADAFSDSAPSDEATRTGGAAAEIERPEVRRFPS